MSCPSASRQLENFRIQLIPGVLTFIQLDFNHLIYTAESGAASESLRPYVTQWGLDPVWLSQPPDAWPSTAAFKNANQTANLLTLDELNDSTLAGALRPPRRSN